METTVTCQIHHDQIAVESALVPAIKLIAKETGRLVTPAMLLDRAVCAGSRKVLGVKGVTLFSYLDTLRRVEERAKERLAAANFASRYRTVRDRPFVPKAKQATVKPFGGAKGKPVTVYAGDSLREVGTGREVSI